MLVRVLRAGSSVSPDLVWIIRYLLAVQAVLVACILVTMRAALNAEDPATREIAYRMFRDLLAHRAPRRRP